VAVVSLPAGVFNPYSGVKTSILILDKALARRTSTIAFFKVEDDGFSLGAQRRAIRKNDLPNAQNELGEYMRRLRSADSLADFQPVLGLVVPKRSVAAMGDYSLSGERYRQVAAATSRWPMVALGEIAGIESGSRDKGGSVESGIPSIGGEQIDDNGAIRFDKMRYISDDHYRAMTRGVLRNGDVLIVKDGATTGKTGFFTFDISSAVNEHVFILRAGEAVLPYYLYRVVRARRFRDKLQPYIKGIIGGINLDFAAITVPLPSVDAQRQIADEIEGYQRIIDGARAVVDNYRPLVPIQAEWPTTPLGKLADNLDSRRVPITKGDRRVGEIPYYGASGIVDYVADLIFDEDLLLVSEDGANLLARATPIAFSISGPAWVNNHAHVLRFADRATQTLVEVYLNSISIAGYVTGAAQPKLTQEALNGIPIPIPDEQGERDRLVAEIEAERSLVAANRDLIVRFEKKIGDTLAHVWGEAESTLAGV
jgi:type I restriction enzyme M protein